MNRKPMTYEEARRVAADNIARAMLGDVSSAMREDAARRGAEVVRALIRSRDPAAVRGSDGRGDGTP